MAKIMKTIIKDALDSINALTSADRREIAEYVNAKIAYSVLLINNSDINPKYLNYYLEVINKFENSVS